MSPRTALVEGASLVARGALHAGVDLFVGYPITPASGIYAEMIRLGVGIAAPDEITALQYLLGGSLAGRRAMTATSGPGFLLMAEGLGAALAMEVPLVVVLVQRVGPATGSATMNAQGDVLLAANVVSGGFPVPVLCPPDLESCAGMTVLAVNLAERLRTPVVLLTEKDMVVGRRTVDLDDLVLPDPVDRPRYTGDAAAFRTYGHWNDDLVPPFRPAGDPEVQVRITASTHDEAGTLRPLDDRARPNTERLLLAADPDVYPSPLEDRQNGADTLVVAYGFTAYAARQAVADARARGRRVSLLVPRTLVPVLGDHLRPALAGVRRLVVAEENLTGLYRQALLGAGIMLGTDVREVIGVNGMGKPIAAQRIADAVGEVQP